LTSSAAALRVSTMARKPQYSEGGVSLPCPESRGGNRFTPTLVGNESRPDQKMGVLRHDDHDAIGPKMEMKFDAGSISHSRLPFLLKNPCRRKQEKVRAWASPGLLNCLQVLRWDMVTASDVSRLDAARSGLVDAYQSCAIRCFMPTQGGGNGTRLRARLPK
jgi:hypothetical protein